MKQNNFTRSSFPSPFHLQGNLLNNFRNSPSLSFFISHTMLPQQLTTNWTSAKDLQAFSGDPGLNHNRVSTGLSTERLTEFIQSIISKKQEEKDPFYALDLGVVKSLMDKWNHSLPNIKPFYAVKCNPHPMFLSALAVLGAGFDCASRAEIEAVLALGVPADRIVYANPCKSEAHIKYAASVGVNITTFDTLNELEKIKKWHPNCALILRVKAPDNSNAKCPLGSKYGALPEEITPLLKAAQAARLNVVGASFHVGSGARNSQAYTSAIAEAKSVFNAALILGMPRMSVLDIGGGFTMGSQFDDAAVTIKAALQTYFPNEPDLELISEPGRYFAETAFTLATNIIGKRVRGDLREYWINDGLYGSMNCIMYDATIVRATPLACSSNTSNPTCQGAKMYASTVFGPTCDALDTILTEYQLPELQLNDWLVFPNMGAYTACAGSNFNGFNISAISTYLANSNVSQDKLG